MKERRRTGMVFCGWCHPSLAELSEDNDGICVNKVCRSSGVSNESIVFYLERKIMRSLGFWLVECFLFKSGGNSQSHRSKIFFCNLCRLSVISE